MKLHKRVTKLLFRLGLSVVAILVVTTILSNASLNNASLKEHQVIVSDSPKIETIATESEECSEVVQYSQPNTQATFESSSKPLKEAVPLEQVSNEPSVDVAVEGTYLGTFDTTAYCLDGITSTGVKPQVGVTIAVDPKVIPYGTKLRLVVKSTGQELGYRIAQDCGGAIKGNKLDIYLASESECRKWGHKNLDVYIVD